MHTIREYFDSLLQASTPQRPVWNQERLRGGQSPGWNYIDGCMLLAVLAMYQATGEKDYFTFADHFIDFYVREDGTILGYEPADYNADNINEGKVLFALYEHTGKEKYKKALDQLYHQLQQQPRTATGNFWHKRIYPQQIWLDGLYMVQPFYMAYEKNFDGYRCYKDSFDQFQQVQRLLRDTETGLYYHGFDETKSVDWADPKTGLSANFWSRSLGWLAMALVDTAELLDEQFFYEYEMLQRQLKSLLDALLPYADEATGLFYQVTDQGRRAGNYLETSGSAAIAYALMKGARLAFLPNYYYEKGERILAALREHKLKKDGAVYTLTDICLVAGLGGMPGQGSYKKRDGSYAYYISEPIVADDAKGIAPLVFAYSEWLRAEKNNKTR